MQMYLALLICLFVTVRSVEDEDVYLTLPQGFSIGAGGSAYQIEGGWNASDKGESIWDRLVHTEPWRIADDSTGDVTCDSYHKYKEDVQWVKKIGLGHYRFSISWSRVLPNGFADDISQDGLQYYHNLIDELLANDIEPSVLLYHWDHPQVLEDLGGWLNESMVSWFADYANVIFREFGPKVKVFSTLNEPQVFCDLGYVTGLHAPGKTLNMRAAYLCGHNALKAHATVYHLYDKVYRPTQHGKIGIVSLCASYFPKYPNETLAADISFQFSCGWMSHPIYIGDYPQVLKEKVAELNIRATGPLEPQLPDFSPEWIDYIKGTADYFGLNHYTTILVQLGGHRNLERSNLRLWDLDITESTDPNWEAGPIDWIHIVPEGFGALLRKIKDEYNNPPVYIMENGIPENEPFNDYQRIKYLHEYLKELLLVVHRDGCNVEMYTVWSLLDNFEWTEGYKKESMGLINVNFSSPNRERVPKLSVTWLQNVTRTRRLQPQILRPNDTSDSY